MESKTKPAKFLAEFPKFTKYLESLAKGGIHLSEPRIVKLTKNVSRIIAEVRCGDAKNPLGELSLTYKKSESGEELVSKAYHGAIKTRDDVTLTYYRYFDDEKAWGRMDCRSRVPFP
jgi:hypothetical protein